MFFDRLLSAAGAVSVVSALLLIPPSCTVKEDRSKCPCLLSVELDRLPALVTVLEGSSGAIIQTLVDESPARLEVPHGTLGISIGAMDDSREEPDKVFKGDGALRILSGNDCPRVWLEHCGDLDTSGEYAQLGATLHRSFAVLTVRIVHPEGETVPYKVEIEGQVDGYLPDTTPSEGKFRVILTPDENLSCSLSLPRQKDNSLLLHITAEGSVLRTFALGETLCRNGYDWSAKDLSDIEVEINYRFSRITISTDLWSTTVPLEIIV